MKEAAVASHPGVTNASDVVVSVRNLTHVYGHGHQEVAVLRDLSFEVHAGRLVAVTGRSGSGKTTLLNLLGGLDTPTSGSILLAGRDVTLLTEHERTQLRRTHVSFIFQAFALLPTLSAYENVALALHIAGVAPRERDRRAREALQLVGLGGRLEHRPFELSGGEQERVAIARSLATRAPLILADEPTGELDTATGRDIIELFREVVRSQHVAVIMATHDNAVVAVADRAYGLSGGVLTVRE